jgi:trimethylamine-N-oxide reductase (cytochrome c)
MKFQILLYILGRKLKAKLKKDPEFKKRLSEKNCTVQFKTADNSRGRYYTFSNGEITTNKGIASDPTVSLVWENASIAFEVLSSQDQTKRMEALQSGKLKLEGDGATALWFTETVKQAK